MNDDFYLTKLREMNRENARAHEIACMCSNIAWGVFFCAFVGLLVIGAFCR